MKTLHLAAIIVSAFFTLFVTSQAYAPCIEGPGINCNGYPPHTLSQIHFDKLNYDTQDKPVITISGVPSTAIHLEIDDSSSNIMFEHDFNLSSNGTARHILDISSYQSGGYSATATSLMSKVTTSFTVGMTPSGGNMDVGVDKNSYLPGDRISILGTANSNTLIQLSLIDPYGTSIRSTKIFSDKTGHFSSSNFTIPINAISGVWQIGATRGVEHAQVQITVNSTLNNRSVIQTYKTTAPSPVKQFKSGINAEDVKCPIGFVLTIKSEDNSPACVELETAQKFVDRGWAKMILAKKGITINSYTPISNDTKKQSEAIDNATYLSQTVDEWKNKTHEQLNAYYEKYKDKFYTELGSFLIKDEMKKELERQNIQNIHDDFKVFPGMVLDSLPPYISYDAVVNATDGNSYLLLGGVFSNKIESIKITKLAFDEDVLNSLSTGKKPSYTNPFVKAPRVVISDQEGTKSPVEPYSLTLDLDRNNLVTFYNNSTVPIRIQPYGSGLTIDEGLLSWKSKVIAPNETIVIPFNKTGYYEWDARTPPKGSENWWDLKGSGQIAASSSHVDNPSQEKLKMAGTYVEDTDIPWSSVGTGSYGVLEIGLYTSVYHMIPDAQKYYTARVMQLIPFYVPVKILPPPITEK